MCAVVLPDHQSPAAAVVAVVASETACLMLISYITCRKVVVASVLEMTAVLVLPCQSERGPHHLFQHTMPILL